ncbi:cytochrome P450 [Natronoarchaeum mannanilyticum]|uniref:cytochrome P450 n=1 Tax=Natronoarchaeum mannanilyticum TaxID=926360 RepID=UPI0031DC2E5F
MSRPTATPPSPRGVPVLGNTIAFASDPFGFVRRSVESTGDVFRMRLLGRDVYVVGDPDHVETVLLNREAFAKLEDFEVAFGDTLLSVEGEQWRRQRHAMEGFFDPTRIAEFAETMVDVAESHVDDWSSGREIGVDDEMRSIALRNLFEVVLGHSLSATERDDLAADAHALNNWFKPTSWVLPYWVPTPARREFRRGSDRLRDWARSLLDDAQDGPDEESLLATLATLQDDPDSEFDRAEVLDQVVGMIFAGHETTALAMTYALHQIAAHPDIADRFHAELDDVIDGRPSFADLRELEYAERVIDEALRLYPPVHAIPRETTERVDLGEYEIPGGEQVLLSVWSIHRDSRFYDEPLAFDPSRWEDTSPRERGYEFVPFGAGPRICIGRHFARLEMKATLAAIGRRYRLDADDEIDVTPQMTTQPAGPVNVRVTDRN